MCGAILGGALITLSLQDQRTRSQRIHQTSLTVSQIKNRLDFYLSDLDLLKPTFESAALPGNIKLNYCLNGTPTPIPTPLPECTDPAKCCPAIGPPGEGVRLVDPGDVERKRWIGGSDAEPARYDSAGLLCPPNQSQCTIEVRTSFVSTCAGVDATCARGESVKMLYSIRSSAGDGASSGIHFPEMRGEIVLK